MNKIKMTFFNELDALNEWRGDGTSVEIISIAFDSRDRLHYVYYVLTDKEAEHRERFENCLVRVTALAKIGQSTGVKTILTVLGAERLSDLENDYERLKKFETVLAINFPNNKPFGKS